MEKQHNSLEAGNVKVEWAELGEGWSGDYDPTDPDDVELLRFDVFVKDKDGAWETPQDCTYCTRVPVSATPEQRAKLLKIILDKVCETIQNRMSVKKICEKLSWICLEWITCVEIMYLKSEVAMK